MSLNLDYMSFKKYALVHIAYLYESNCCFAYTFMCLLRFVTFPNVYNKQRSPAYEKEHLWNWFLFIRQVQNNLRTKTVVNIFKLLVLKINFSRKQSNFTCYLKDKSKEKVYFVLKFNTTDAVLLVSVSQSFI